MSRIRAFTRSAAVMSVFSLIAYGQVLLAPAAQAQPFSGGLSPTVFSATADLNGDDAVSGRDDSNAFYGDTAIIDGKLDCNAWGLSPNAGTAGDGTITAADACTLIGYDGTPDGVTITVANGSFVLADLAPIPDGTALPTVFNAADPDNPSVAAADFAWSTIGGRVDANGDEAIDADDCSLGLIGETVDAGLGNPHDGADVVSTNASGVNPCEGLIGPAAADDGLVDLNSDKNITLAGDTCNNGCFLGHNLKEGLVQTTGSPATVVPPSNPNTGGLSPTIFGAAADLNGDGVVNGRDDSNAFYGDTAIIDGKLDCNAWPAENDGTVGDGAITTADDCILVGYDGTPDGVTITVANGLFVLADGSPIADGTALPTVFNAADPDNSSVALADFAWSTIGGRVDANGDEAIGSDDCTLGLIGQTVDAGLGDAHDGADVLSTNATGVNPCTGLIGPAAADDGLVDVDSDGNITFAGDSCTDGCFLGHDVLEGVVQGVPAISIGDVTVSEGAGTATFTVTLSAATQSTVTVDYATANGSATAGSDYTATSGTVTFTAGDTSENVSVAILNDLTDEPDETFLVNLSNPSDATISDAQGQGTIQDNDGAPVISINDVTVGEAAGSAVFTVTLSNPSSQTVTVDYATANGTATAGSDYTATSGTVTFTAGDTSEPVSVPISNDADIESNETFVVNLTNPTNATIGDAQGQGTIQDNDASITINDVTVNEAAGTATFTVSLSPAAQNTVTVDYATANGTATAGSDYTAASGTVTFTAGDTSENVSVTILNDSTDEADETFVVNLTNATNATIADTQGQGTIQDNDATPSVLIDDVTVGEAAGSAVFTVSLSNPSSQTVTVDYATANGTATAGSDYTAASGTVTFVAGDTSETVSVTVLNDSTDEPDETFFVDLSNPSNATIGDAQGQGTIQDNDGAPSISIDDVTVGEAAGTAGFTVSLSNPSTQTVTVDYTTADGTATAGSDYTAASGTVTFVAGDTSEPVNVAILNDTVDEADETFVVNLTNPANATIGDAQGQGTIQDNDAAPSISIDDVTVGEAAGTATFTVSLSAASGQTVTVNYATANGTATAGSDYTAASGTVTFVAGDASETVSVTVLNDSTDEADETFVVNLTNPANATIDDAQGQGTIQDNDAAPSISINDVSVSEGAGTATFTVSLSAASGQTVTVNYATANGTATAGSDYTAASGTVTFVAGDTSEPVNVAILNDTVDEPNETFVVDLSNPSNGSISDAQGQGTIVDNDAPEQTFDDVPPSHFAFESVEKLVDAGITAGCSTSPPLYCPNNPVTRGQMAVFMLRAMGHGDPSHLPAYRGIFADVPASHPFARYIEHLFDHGVTAGCSTNPRRYCPGDSVTRGQMSVFLLRAIDHDGHLPPYRGIFADVPASHPFARFIEHLFDHGITAGCSTNPRKYCPNSAVTRAQMAVFIVRAFEL